MRFQYGVNVGIVKRYSEYQWCYALIIRFWLEGL